MDFTVFKCMLHMYKWMQETKAFSIKPSLVENGHRMDDCNIYATWV
jgi:hypothetical protein